MTSELRDSYFRLMTIKHAISKIEWAIEWAIELLYNSGKTGSQTSWRSDKLDIRYGKESHHPAEEALGTPDGFWGTRPVGDKMQ